MQIISGIPIWVAGDASDDPLTQPDEGKDQLVQALDALLHVYSTADNGERLSTVIRLLPRLWSTSETAIHE